MSSELDGCVPGSRIGWFEGGACSRLGLPLTDEIDGYGGRVSTFQHGRIVWTAAGGAVVTYY